MPNLLEVKLYGSEVLKKVAEPVIEITEEIKSLVADMFYTMYQTEGVGLAAPQVGVSLRIFVCDPEYTKTENRKPVVLINPEFTLFEGDYEVEEGCLSVPGIFEEIVRFKSVKIKYKDLDWQDKELIAKDTFAVILQHEYDHLDGKTFVDKLSQIRRMANAFKLNRIMKKAQKMSEDLVVIKE